LPSFSLNDVTLGYDGHPAVHHLEGKFVSGSLTAVVGPNGSGKSTLLKGLSGVLLPMGGHIDLIGCNARDVAYLPQASDVDRTFPSTVEDLVMMGLWRKRGLFASIGKADLALASTALATVGLDGFQSRTLNTLSGGQFQRALFARVLLQDSRVILLDEPFSAIDGRTISDLMHLIRQWHSEGRTVIAVLHDMNLVTEHFPDAILLAREPVAWGPTPAVLSAENLSRARRMHEAWDDHAAPCKRDAA
jgi:zinc/manganese transport system ATP-binding protein